MPCFPCHWQIYLWEYARRDCAGIRCFVLDWAFQHLTLHGVKHCVLDLLQGILGQGSGKALEAKSAVDKATRKALKHLMYVPRFRAHTIHYPLTVLYGKTKVRQPFDCSAVQWACCRRLQMDVIAARHLLVHQETCRSAVFVAYTLAASRRAAVKPGILSLQLIMYPKASGRGIKASNLMKALCQLAGIQDVGIKIQVPIQVPVGYIIPRSAVALQEHYITLATQLSSWLFCVHVHCHSCECMPDPHC